MPTAGTCAASPRGWMLVDVTAYRQEQAHRTGVIAGRQPG
jgi:hypothetical protein